MSWFGCWGDFMIERGRGNDELVVMFMFQDG